VGGGGVGGLPEENAQATCGILTGVSMHGGSRIIWRYERQGPHKIAYRMDKDISALRFASADDKD
jgi:hypothetical protein